MDRVDAVRKAMVNPAGPEELVIRPGCERHGALGAWILRRLFFPDLAVRVVEAYAAEGDRVVAVLELAACGTTWEAVAIVRFDGDEVVEVRTIAEEVEWLQALGVVPDDATLERALDALIDAAPAPGT